MNIRLLIKKVLQIITIKKMTSDLGIYYGCDKIFKDNITDGIIYGEYRC